MDTAVEQVKLPKVLFASQLNDERKVWDIPSNEVRMWAYMLQAETYCPMTHALWDIEYLRQFDLVIVERPNSEAFITFLVEKGVPVISLEEGPLNINISDNGIKAMTNLWRMVPMVGSINSSRDVQVIQSFTDKPVISMTPAIPIDYLESVSVNVNERSKDRYIHVWTAGHHPGGTLKSFFNMAVLARLKEYKHVVYTHVSTMEKEAQFYSDIGLRNFEMKPAVGWHKHAQQHAHAWLTLNLDVRLSAYRISRDSAVLEIPAIGNISNYNQYQLFGLDTSVDLYDIEKTVSIIKNLMEDDITKEDSLYMKITREAHQSAINHYSSDILTKQFLDDVRKYYPEWLDGKA